MHGVHLSGEVHRGLGRDQPQRGPPAGRDSESDTTEERAGERGEPYRKRG